MRLQLLTPPEGSVPTPGSVGCTAPAETAASGMGGPSSTLVAGVLLVVVAVSGLLYNEIVSSSQGRLAAVEKMNRHLREELERCERDHRWRDARMLNGHVPVADGYLPQEYPLPSLNGRIPFPDADYGDCQPFMVPHGRVYGKLQPSQEDRVGHRWPGRVFVRCNRGFELRSGSNPDRMCLSVEGASSWSPGGGDWASSICVAATPAAGAASTTHASTRSTTRARRTAAQRVARPCRTTRQRRATVSCAATCVPRSPRRRCAPFSGPDPSS